MAANLRRGNLPTETTMARFMYYIIKQLDVRGVDWALVADNMDITNGHAARMRYARYKNQVEGVQPRPREPRAAGSGGSKNRGRPVKKQKVELGKKEEEGEEGGVKKEQGGKEGAHKEKKVKREKNAEGMPNAKMRGALGPGAGIKREFDDVDAEGEVDEMAENHMDLTRNGSMGENSLGRKGSEAEMAVGIKKELVEAEGGTEGRISFLKSTAGGEGGDASGESNTRTTTAATTTTQPLSASTSANKATVTRPQPSSHTISPALTFNASTIPSMHHIQLNQPPPSQRLFSTDMAMQHRNTPPPPSPQNLSSNHAGQGGFTYPVPSYHTYASRSPATTSSAPYSLPPSPVDGGGYHSEMNGYGGMAQGGMSGGADSYDMGVGVQNGIMMNQGSFVGMLQDPSFPNDYEVGGGGYGGVGGWEGMYQ